MRKLLTIATVLTGSLILGAGLAGCTVASETPNPTPGAGSTPSSEPGDSVNPTENQTFPVLDLKDAKLNLDDTVVPAGFKYISKEQGAGEPAPDPNAFLYSNEERTCFISGSFVPVTVYPGEENIDLTEAHIKGLETDEVKITERFDASVKANNENLGLAGYQVTKTVEGNTTVSYEAFRVFATEVESDVVVEEGQDPVTARLAFSSVYSCSDKEPKKDVFVEFLKGLDITYTKN